MRTPWILEREGYYSVVNGYKDPFLDKEAGKRTHEDRYLTGTSFNDLYALFVFDRNLRFLLFRMTTLSEAILKTICSYEFTKENAEEKNPYLNIANYAETGKAHDKAVLLIPKLEKIISLNRKVVPEKLRTLDHGRPWSDDQFASTRLSSNRDMSR